MQASHWLGDMRGVALITGAGSGIGREVAKAFAGVGARLVLVDANQEGLKATAAETGCEPEAMIQAAIDLRDTSAVSDLFKTIKERFQRLDFAVNCAAIVGQPQHTLLDHPQEDWDRVIDVNLRAQVTLLREEIRMMLSNDPIGQRGAILTLSSYRGMHGFPLRIPYTTTKFALIGLSRSAAIGYARQGVRINQVAPGFIDTPMANATVTDPKQLENWVDNQIPIARKGQPKEVADLCLFLCSERASYIVGETISIDGGLGAM